MSRFARRVDANLREIVVAYRRLGCKVRVNNDDTCDCIVQFGGITDLVEVKNSAKPLSARKLTANQKKVHDQLMIRIVTGLDNVVEHVAALRMKSMILFREMR